MANTIFQIRRSNTTATPASSFLAAGELAFSYASNTLFIGPNTGPTSGASIPIASVLFPGTLTANAVLVANSLSGINSIQAGNVVLLGTAGSINANGSTGTAGQVLFSGGTGANAYWAAGAVNVAAQYTWSNTQNFTNTITFNTQLVVNASTFVANGTQVTISAVPLSANGTTGTAGYVLASNGVSGSPYWVAASAGLTGSQIAANNWTFTNTIAVSNTFAVTGGYINVAANISITNTAIILAGNTTTAPTLTIASNSTTGITYGNSSITGLPSILLANSSGNTTINSISIATSYGFNVNSSVLSFTGGNVSATSANLAVLNATISGNLTVSGTLTTINTTNLQVNDNLIQLADLQASTATFTDTVDAGFSLGTGNTSATYWSGIARIATLSTNTNPYFKIFETAINPITLTTIDAAANTGTLQSYLNPYGATGAFVVNATAIAITANSTVSASITGNTLSLATALGVGSGGTGLNTLASGSLLYGSGGTSALTVLAIPGSSANGQVLQIFNNLPTYGGIDGGTF